MSNTNMQTQTSSVLQNDTVSSCSISKVQEKTQLSRIKCMNSLRAIQSQLKFLIETLQDFGNMHIFKRTFSQDLDLLENHLTKEIISQTDCKTTLTKLRTTLENAFSSEIKARMQNYTRYDAQSFYDAMIFNMDSLGKYMIDKIDMGKVLDNGLVVMESNGTESEVQDDSSMPGNDTDADDADIRPIYDEEPMVEVQLSAECNIFAIGQKHTEQPEIIVEGRVDQYPETCQVKSPMLDSSLDNQTTEYSKQSLESENILLKKTFAQFQKDFSRMEAHCIALELKYQNQ
ncbi:hypothetical protein Tco_0328703, partial [Tanacetum coccineum]